MLPSRGCWPQIPALNSRARRYHLAFRKSNSITAHKYTSGVSTSVCISGLLHSLLACILLSYLISGWAIKLPQTSRKRRSITDRYFLTAVNWFFSIDLHRAASASIRWGSGHLKNVLIEGKAQVYFIFSDNLCITWCKQDIPSQK